MASTMGITTSTEELIMSLLTWISNIPRAIISGDERWLASIKHGVTPLLSAIVHLAKVYMGLIIAAIFAQLAYTAICEVWRFYLEYSTEAARREQHARIQREAELEARRCEEDRRREQEREQQRQQQRELERERQRRAAQEERIKSERQRKAAEQERLKREFLRRLKEQTERLSTVSDRTAYNEWASRCASFLADKKHAINFPNPPVWPCTMCRENEILKACKNTIKRLYRASGKDLKTLLKEERIKWHPDRFSVCPAPTGEVSRAKATEMFKIIESLLNE